MKNKQTSRYVCQQCGYEFYKWEGRCSQCGQWNSLVESKQTLETGGFRKSRVGDGKVMDVLSLPQVKRKLFKRIVTGISELDRVLGGGIVPGSLVLVAGEPGIGKSTLLTQLALKLAESNFQFRPPAGGSNFQKKSKSKIQNSKKGRINSVLYVCGEESPSQVRIRIERLKWKLPEASKNFLFLSETNVENILATCLAKARDYGIGFIIIDSVQTLWSRSLVGAPGSVGQVRECSNRMLSLAKKTDIPVFLIGHVTKEGAIAGPKVLEHLVDTVLYIEGDREHEYRILRSTKNRFGPTDEVGIFSMGERGMEEVGDASEIFLTRRDKLHLKSSGRAVVVVLQGLRPMLVEIQALVVSSTLVMPRRVASGVDYKKLQVLTAVLQKRANLNLSNQDVFVNVVGGLKITEPVADLAVSMAIASSYKNKPLPEESVVLGEVGLLGEIRPVASMAKRIKEAKRLGYKTMIGLGEKSLAEALSRFLSS